MRSTVHNVLRCFPSPLPAVENVKHGAKLRRVLGMFEAREQRYTISTVQCMRGEAATCD